MDKKNIGIIIVILLIIIGAVGYISYTNPKIIGDSSKTVKVGASKVSIPAGYDVQKNASNGVLFSNSKTDIGIYEVPKGDSFDKKVKELEKEHENSTISNETSNKDGITLQIVQVKNEKNKFKETYFEKNGVKYHIYEKGAEDQSAFDTLFNSISK